MKSKQQKTDDAQLPTDDYHHAIGSKECTPDETHNHTISTLKRKMSHSVYEEAISEHKNQQENSLSSPKIKRLNDAASDVGENHLQQNLQKAPQPSTSIEGVQKANNNGPITNDHSPPSRTEAIISNSPPVVPHHRTTITPSVNAKINPPLTNEDASPTPMLSSPLLFNRLLQETNKMITAPPPSATNNDRHTATSLPSFVVTQPVMVGHNDNQLPQRLRRSNLSKTVSIYNQAIDDPSLHESDSSQESKFSDQQDEDYIPSDHHSIKSDSHDDNIHRPTTTRCLRKNNANEPLVLCCNTMTRQSKRKKIKRPNITVYEIDPGRSLCWNMGNYIMNHFFTENYCQVGGKEMLQKFSKKAQKRRTKICNLWLKYGQKFFNEQLANKTSKATETKQPSTRSYPACYVEISCETLYRDLNIKTDYETILKILQGIGARFDTVVSRNMIDGLCIENRFTLHIKDLFDLLRHLDDELMADWYEIYYKNQVLYPNGYPHATVWSDNDEPHTSQNRVNHLDNRPSVSDGDKESGPP